MSHRPKRQEKFFPLGEGSPCLTACCAANRSFPEKQEGHGLARTLGWPHLIALGVGAIVGTGILTLIGVGADKAGPAVILSLRHRRR